MFTSFGGVTGSVSAAMLHLAFDVAEMQVEEFLGSPLNPVTITGTFSLYPYQEVQTLPWMGVISVDRLSYTTSSGSAIMRTDIAWPQMYLVNQEAGVLNVRGLWAGCSLWPQMVEIVYTAGFPTGTLAVNPKVQAALVQASRLVLNELQNPGAYEVAVGIQHFSSMRYSETRFKLKDTSFGSSAAAQYIAKLLEKLRYRRVGRV